MAGIPGGSHEPMVMCDRAEYLNAQAKLQSSYSLLCLRGMRMVRDAEVWDRLHAESEARKDVAQEAKRIVRKCDGCDGEGKRMKDLEECPEATVHQVEDWLWKVSRI